MGIHTGIECSEDVVLNEATSRKMYSGQSMALAKAVSDAAHGGQVLASEATYKMLPLEKLGGYFHVLHGGYHLLADDLPSMQVDTLCNSHIKISR